jgi:GNAT superfamily N-acetyltransferase
MQILRVTTEENAKICDDFLTQLIQYESKLDKLINPRYVVEDFYKRTLDNPSKYLALAIAKDKPIGFIYAYREVAKGTSFSDNIICIDGLFIKDSYRSLGVGTALIKSVEDWALRTYGTAHIDITYINTNIPAKNCYEKLGFTPVKTILRKKI